MRQRERTAETEKQTEREEDRKRERVSERVSENRDLWHIPNPSVVISIVVRIAFSAYKASHTYTPVS